MWTLLTLLAGYLKPIMFGFNIIEEPPAGDPPDGDPPSGDPPPAGTPPPAAVVKWTDNLPPEIKAHPVLSKYKDSTEAVKALVEAQSLIGADKIIIPSKDAKPEEWNARVWDRLGRPKDPAGYVLPTDLKIPEDLPIDEKLVTNFKAEAHKQGLLPHQVAAMYKWFMNEQIAQHGIFKEGINTTRNEAETKLRRDWGAAFGQNVALGEKVLDAFAEPETLTFLKQNGLHNDPSFIKFLAKIGSSFSEDQLIGKPRGLTLTPEEAQIEINKIRNDMKGPLYDDKHPEHKAMVDKVEFLTKMVHPE